MGRKTPFCPFNKVRCLVSNTRGTRQRKAMQTRPEYLHVAAVQLQTIDTPTCDFRNVLSQVAFAPSKMLTRKSSVVEINSQFHPPDPRHKPWMTKQYPVIRWCVDHEGRRLNGRNKRQFKATSWQSQSNRHLGLQHQDSACRHDRTYISCNWSASQLIPCGKRFRSAWIPRLASLSRSIQQSSM